MGPITLTSADQLYWLGRYTERVYTTLRRFFSTYDQGIDHGPEDFRSFCRELDIPFDPELSTDDLIRGFLYDRDRPWSVCSSMRAAFGNAMMLRSELGTPTTAYVELALIRLKESKEPDTRLLRQRSVHDDLLAFWGSIEDGTALPEVKALLFTGKYIERLDLYARFGAPSERLDLAAEKLARQIEAIAHPECLPVSSTLTWLAEALSGRGYAAVGEKVAALAAQADGAAPVRPAGPGVPVVQASSAGRRPVEGPAPQQRLARAEGRGR